jgi:MoxR-like ATPase
VQFTPDLMPSDVTGASIFDLRLLELKPEDCDRRLS